MNIDIFKDYYSRCFNSDGTTTTESHLQKQNEVNEKLNQILNQRYHLEFSDSQIEYAINQLNHGKAFGYDSVTAEMLINSKSNYLLSTLGWFYTAIFNFGIIPTNLNVSMVTPIPKGKEIPQKPTSFRPISVSTTFANLFETLLLYNGATNLVNMHTNQFGYQKKLSCKHAYFVINESLQYFGSLRRRVEIAQLDAEKAFDALWRVGLFHKLMDKIEPVYFRALVSYFNVSQIIVKYDGQQTDLINTKNGCKQGCILSTYSTSIWMT